MSVRKYVGCLLKGEIYFFYILATLNTALKNPGMYREENSVPASRISKLWVVWLRCVICIAKWIRFTPVSFCIVLLDTIKFCWHLDKSASETYPWYNKRILMKIGLLGKLYSNGTYLFLLVVNLLRYCASLGKRFSKKAVFSEKKNCEKPFVGWHGQFERKGTFGDKNQYNLFCRKWGSKYFSFINFFKNFHNTMKNNFFGGGTWPFWGKEAIDDKNE